MSRKTKKAANVVPFTGATSESKAKLSHAEILELLIGMDDVEYDRQRHALAVEQGILLETLDCLRKQALNIQRYRARPQQAEPEPSELEKTVRPILETEGILDLWASDWDKVMAGEHLNAKLLYLVATTRLFDQGMHAAIKGQSSAGKSQIRKRVLSFFPPEDIISFTMLSEKALLWFEDDFCHKILSMGEAVGGKAWEMQDMLLRELMSEGVLNYPVSQVINGRVQTITITKHGPVVFMVTTTKAALHPENETRMLSLHVDDSDAQTACVMQKQAKTQGLNLAPDESITYRWQDFQRLLRIIGKKRGGWRVAVPFAEALAELIPPRTARLRRDYVQVLLAIKAHAMIHVYRRAENERGEIIADLDLDYAPVVELIGHIASEGAGVSVSPEVMETIEAVRLAQVNCPEDGGATAFEIGKILKLHKTTVGDRLKQAHAKGFVVNMEPKPNRPGKWRLTDQEVQSETLLPTVKQIKEVLSPVGGGKPTQPPYREENKYE